MFKLNQTRIDCKLIFLTLVLSLASACGGSGSDDATNTTDGGGSTGEPTIESYPFLFTGNDGVHGGELWTSDGTEAGTMLVKDIAPYGSSYPSGFIRIGTSLLFNADDGVNGSELWKVDLSSGTSSLVKDANPEGSSVFYSITEHDGEAYFVMNDGNATSLWKSDGTTLGTSVIDSIPVNASLDNSVSLGNELYFIANNEVYLTDGITISILDTSNQFTQPSQLTVFNGELFFIAHTATEGYEVWHSDGTDSGTSLLVDTDPGATVYGLSDNYGGSINVMGSSLVFLATEAGTSSQIRYVWLSDGTAVGTARVLDSLSNPITVGRYDQTTVMNDSLFVASSSYPYPLKVFDGASLVDVGTVGISSVRTIFSSGSNLYISNYSSVYVNGGNSDSVLLIDKLSYISSFRSVDGGGVVFTARGYDDAGVYRDLLIYSDGTIDGTALIATDGYRYYNGNFYVSGSVVYYGNKISGEDTELFSWNVATSTSTVLSDINQTNRDSAAPYGPVYLNGFVYFIVGSDENQLWRSDGTAAGTTRVGDLSTLPFRYIESLTPSGGNIYFIAETSEYGRELWMTDGTMEGTHLVIDLNFGSSGTNFNGLLDVNGTLYFSANHILWALSSGNVMPVFSGNRVRQLFPFTGDRFLFISESEFAGMSSGYELFISDGTLVGTELVKDINPLGSSLTYDTQAFLFGENVYFTADNGENGRELWKTDGTEVGTIMLSDINSTNAVGSLGVDPLFFVLNGDIFFVTNETDTVNSDIWRVLDKDAGVEKVTDFAAGNVQIRSRYDDHHNYALFNDLLYFVASDPVNGEEIWRSDGTQAGTKLFVNIAADNGDAVSSYPECLTVRKGILYFTATDEIDGYELWASDGTEAGTHMVTDIFPGTEEGGAYCLGDYDNF